MIERTLLKIEPIHALLRSWNDPTKKGPGRFMLCIHDARDYFDIPLVDDVTLVLSTRYSEGTCYEFRPAVHRDYDPRIVIDGEPQEIALYVGLVMKIECFLKEHAHCYLSLEYTE